MDGYGKCHECVKFGTPDCPTSSKCMALDELPFFEAKPRKKNLIDKIKDKIKLLIAEVRKRYTYGKCYGRHEGYGAIFEMCNKCDDENCPYHVE